MDEAGWIFKSGSTGLEQYVLVLSHAAHMGELLLCTCHLT